MIRTKSRIIRDVKFSSLANLVNSSRALIKE